MNADQESRAEVPSYAIPVGVPSDSRLDPATPLTEQQLRFLTDNFLLPRFHNSGAEWILADDLTKVVTIFDPRHEAFKGSVYPETLFDDGRPSAINLGPNSELELGAWASADDPAVYAAVRNLTLQAARETSVYRGTRRHVPYFPPVLLTTSSPKVEAAATEQLEHARLLKTSRTSEFANTAYYMGSKRS